MWEEGRRKKVVLEALKSGSFREELCASESVPRLNISCSALLEYLPIQQLGR